MNYRSNNDKKNLSVLGFGCMRFPRKGNSFDMEEIEREIMHAIDRGVNYFDTAYIYPGSEDALGTVLEKNGCREKIKIATKLPHYMMKTRAEMEKHFSEQLTRLKTDYVDFYLMHMLPDMKTWNSLIERGALEWLLELKAAGKIKHLGFSYHGNTHTFQELLNAYDWDFCQIQYNYMDEYAQAGRAGLEAAAAKGIPVIIMEPLRGGRLVNDLPKAAKQAMAQSNHNWSPAEWALRWLWNQSGVSVVLSGMNSMEMLDENIRIASETMVDSLTSSELSVFDDIKQAINAKIKVPCTGCSYCMPCPMGVDIPGSFRCYNVSYTDGYVNGMREYFMCTTMKAQKSNVSRCIECGKCETHCPQEISIRQELKHVKHRFENPIYHIGKAVLKQCQLLFLALIISSLIGCGAKADAGTVSDNNADASQITVSDSSALIDSMLTENTVSADAAVSDNTVDSNKQIIPVYRTNGSNGFVSSAPGSGTAAADTDDDEDSVFTMDEDDTTTGYGTPVNFDVDDCMILVDGTYNTTIPDEILTALNTARTNAGLNTFDVNDSLKKTADVRAKEITYSVGHLRANGSYWNTVAPQYYEAECLAVDYTTAVDTVNAWLGNTGTSEYLLNEDLCSIGISCFQYADNYYIVASLGS